MNSPVSLPSKPYPLVEPELPPAPPPEVAPRQPEPSRQQKRRRQRRRRRLILLVAVVLVAGGGYAAYRVYLAPSTTTETRYITALVGTGNIEDAVSAVGTLSASESRTIEVPVAGKIATINVAIGDVVAVGDVIATLDATSFQNAVTLAQAQLAQSQAGLANQQTQLDLAQQNLTRQQGLLAASAAAESAVQQAQAQIVQATSSLQSARTDLIQKQQALDTANANLAGAAITAPIAGTVVDLPVQVGQSLTAGTATMTLANLATMTVEAAVSEADVSRLYVGMPAYFTTLAGSTRRWTGTLRQILPTPTVENNVVMYNLLFDVDNADKTLMIGMSTESFFVVVGASNVLTVPVAALQSARLLRTADAAGTPATGAAGGAATAAGAVPADPNAAAAATASPAAPATADASAAPADATGAGPGAGRFAGGDPSQIAARLQAAGIDPATVQQRLAQGGGAGFGGAGGGFGGAGGGRFGGQAATPTTAPGGTPTPTQYAVRVMHDDGTIEERAVEIGAEDRVNAEVLSGLTAGEKVVTSVVTSATGATANAGAPGGGAGAGGFAAAGFAGGGAPGGGGAAFFGGR